MKRIFGIYEVEETFKEDGSWGGYTCRCLDSDKKQGKLYIPKDGREHYAAKPKDEDLEI